MTQNLLKKWISDNRGASAVEFAIVVIPMLMLIMGMLDLGHTAYLRALLQGSVDKAARDSALQATPSQLAAADASVVSQVQNAINVPASAFTFTRTNFTSFTYVGGEPFTDTNNNGVCDPGELYSDTNGNGHYDASLGQTGQGSANAIVLYQASVTYTHIFPVYGLVGMSPVQTLKAQTVLRNQPYAASNNYTYVAPIVRSC